MFVPLRIIRWICLLTMLITFGEALETIEADSDFGALLIVRNNTAYDDWGVLFVKRGIFFRSDSRETFYMERQTRYREYYNSYDDYYEHIEFSPTTLTIQRRQNMGNNSFPRGLMQSKYFRKLQTLEMTHSNLESIDRSGFLNQNALKILNLSFNALTNIPSFAFSSAWNLTSVDLSYNHITDIAWDAFNLEDDSSRVLQTLRLDHNNLTYIDSKWFQHLSHLNLLTLNDNFIGKLDVCKSFQTNSALRSLELRNNPIHVFTMGNSTCPSQLGTFDASNSSTLSGKFSVTVAVNAESVKISHANVRRCTIFDRTTIFDGSHNAIDSIQIDTANNSLRELQLSHNRIEDVAFLQKLGELEILDLSHNRLKSIERGTFDFNVNLNKLDVAYNQMVSVDFQAIESKPKLQYLNIANNLLSGHFQLDVVRTALIELIIANNSYTSIQQNLRKSMPLLQRIDLNGNSFDCDNLTLTLLFLHFDHIKPVIDKYNNDLDLDGAGNVRGIKCHRPNSEFGAIDVPKTKLKMTEMALIKRIDDGLARLEEKVIDLFENGPTTKPTDSGI